MSRTETASPEADPWLGLVRDKVGTIRFGSVRITVHEGRVTQVETIEKRRLISGRIEMPLTATRLKPQH